jgi:hypothetical protein
MFFLRQTAVFSTRNTGSSTHILIRVLLAVVVGEQKIFKGCFTRDYMFGWFLGKKDVEKAKEEAKKGFENVKKDMSSISGWIKHLDSEKNLQKKEMEDLKDILSTIQEEVEGVKNVLAIMNDMKTNTVFKTPKRLSNKQAAVYPVQTAVQTAVQTPDFDQFSITERAIIWILLNADMKLSYDDLAAMLGKERSTIRGQINAIKQKSESLIEETIEKNGKKRIFIPEILREKLLKKTKVRIKKAKNSEKDEKNRVSEY